MTKPDRNVTAGTTDSSYPSGTPGALARKQNRPQNGTELLPDRLAEIRARLDALVESWDGIPTQEDMQMFSMGDYPAIANAPADIAWLLDEVERLTARVRMYEEVKS